MCKCINSLTRIFSDLKIIKPDTTSGFFIYIHSTLLTISEYFTGFAFP